MIKDLIIIFLILVIIFMYFNFRCQIDKINRSISEVKAGNYNERVRMQINISYMKELSSNINSVLSNFQKIIEKKNYLENSRKKMISNMSHDLRTPLTSMLGYLEAIKSDELDEETQRKYIDTAYKKAEYLHDIMEEFFSLSKLEANDITLNIERINICDIVRDILAGMYNDFMNKGIEPAIILPEKDLFISADINSIKRILGNLLSNALRYVNEDGKIGAELTSEESFVVISIWNTGNGISKEDIPYVFDRLYTLESSRNRNFQGSGLGLTIAKELVEKQKGSITVESIQNERTTFKISLPIIK